MTQIIGNVFLNNNRLPDANQEIHRSSLKNLYTLKKIGIQKQIRKVDPDPSNSLTDP